MSVTSMLKGQSERDKEFQKIIKNIVPKKESIRTFSNIDAFSKSYMVLVSKEYNNIYYSSVAGTAFDYLARFTTASIVEKDKWKAFINLNAYKGLVILKSFLNTEAYEFYEELYIKCLVNIMEYIYSNSLIDGIDKIFNEITNQIELEAYERFIDRKTFDFNINQVIISGIFFAKLELIYRSKKLPNSLQMLTDIDEKLFEDVFKLCSVFEDKFVKTKLIKTDSDVVYNPSFGQMSIRVGGADADIYIDGVLYDFKTSIKNGYAWRDFGQLITYYLLNELADEKDKKATIKSKKISKLAIYKARYGEVEYINIENLSPKVICDAKERIELYLNR